MPTNTSELKLFIQKFRNASPYINAFRNKIFVIYFDSYHLSENAFASFIQDIGLLHSLGIRIILIHEKINSNDDVIGFEKILNIQKESAILRHKIEALITKTVNNSPFFLDKKTNTSCNIICGNFVSAQPKGVIEGINQQHAGNTRKIQVDKIKQFLEQNNIVLISPLAYSPSGEMFSIDAQQLAVKCAIDCGAQKIIYASTFAGIMDPNSNTLIKELSADELHAMHQQFPQLLKNINPSHLNQAICGQVKKIQFIDLQIDGALIAELFTEHGIGTLIKNDQLEQISHSGIQDIEGILSIIQPLIKQGIMIDRNRQQIELEIQNFVVLKRKQQIVACCALYPSEPGYAELVCLAVHPDFQHNGRATKLFQFIVRQSRMQGFRYLYVLTTQTAHWFLERGFVKADISALPYEKKHTYNYQRNSEIYMLEL